MSFHPDVTVAAVVEHEGGFLMVEEIVSGQPVINQPAGHLEDGESLLEAVVRETLEETAWQFHPDALTGLYLWRNPANGRSFLRVAFAGRCVNHDPARPLDDGICRAVWLRREDLVREVSRLRSPMVLRCIDDYLLGQRFPLDLVNHLSDLPTEALKQVAL